MYSPQTDDLDFEIGAFGDRFKRAMKKGVKGFKKGLNAVTDATIVKPSAFIGGAIGGKKGRALGRKLGKITAGATKFGVGAGVAGAALPIVAGPAGLTAATAVVAGKAVKGKKKKIKKALKAGFKAGVKATKKAEKKKASAKKADCKCDNAEAAKVASLLVEKLGKPLDEAKRALKLAELQREATYEHKKLMSDAEFRRKVLTSIAQLAAEGNASCERTIRVLVGR